MRPGSEHRRPTGVPRWWWLVGMLVLLLAAALPVIGNWQRRDREVRCALDGQEIAPLFRVGLVEKKGTQRSFCCLLCAELWLERSSAEWRRVVVTDENSGDSLDAAQAHYVRSTVLSNAPTEDRRHVFATRKDAETHAAMYRGRILEGSQRPFAKFLQYEEDVSK